MKYKAYYFCDDSRRLTTGDCGKHNPIVYGSGMVEQRSCEHCYCLMTVDGDRHKQCCNCGNRQKLIFWK